MSENNNKEHYISFDSVISLSLVAENIEKKRAMYVMRLECLEETIHLRKCNPLSDFCLIKESLFIIKHIQESDSSEGILENADEAEKNNELYYNQNFILQHMVSKKYLSKDKLNGNNNYQLKLVDNEASAISLSFRKIVDTRSAQNRIKFNQIVYLSVFIKEKGQYYYLNQQGPKKKSSEDYSDLIVEREYSNKFVVINQSCYGSDSGFLYSGDLVNIVFQEKQQLNEKSYMIGVECQKEDKSGEIISLKEEVKEDLDNLIKENTNQANDLFDFKMESKKDQGNKYIKPFKIKNELFKHVNHYSFWIIEEENFSSYSRRQRTPISAESFVRIKNPILNLYLKIRNKSQNEGTLLNNQTDEYEFELVEEKELLQNLLFVSNFQIFHYSINCESKNLIDNGKYVIKSIFRDFNKKPRENNFDINSINSYFEPISLTNISDKRIVVKKGEEFVFEIKKVNIYKGNEAIYLKHIIENLDYSVKNYNKKGYNQSTVIEVISKHLSFFTNYLMNLDYSFKDINLETNFPVPSRQGLLSKFKILDIITQIINYFLPSVRQQRDKKAKDGTKADQINTGLRNLMKQVLTFLRYLSLNNEKIKQEIFCEMKNLLDLCEFLFPKERTILLDFIFVILRGSNALQECVLGSNTMLKNAFKNNKQKFPERKDSLILIDKIFSYIETSQNYLYFYKKIINFDKVSYKKEEIYKRIKDHIKKVNHDFEKAKNNPAIRNYKTILTKRINKVENLLKDLNIINVFSKEQTKELSSFIKFFNKIKLNDSLFFKDTFTDELINKDVLQNRNDYIDKKLLFIINENINPEKFISDLKIDVNSQLAPLYPLHFLNKVFPKLPEEEESNENEEEEEDDKTKKKPLNKSKDSNSQISNTSKVDLQNNNINLTGMINANNANEIATSNKKQEKEKRAKLYKNLCILYSTYQFYVNQFFEAIYAVLKSFKNIIVNYETFCDLELLINYLEFIYKHLLNKVKLLPDFPLYELYENVKEKPTTFKTTFDISLMNDSHLQSSLSSEEIYEVKFLYQYCRNLDRIYFYKDKLEIFSQIRQLLQSSEGNNPENPEKVFKDILSKLNRKKQDYLSLYQWLSREKKKLISSKIFNAGTIKAYLLQKRIKFVTRLLGKCDVTHYFDKMIYIKSEEFLTHLKRSSFEFKNIKEQIENIHNGIDVNNLYQKNEKNEKNEGNIISSIIKSLEEILKQFKTIFNEQKRNMTLKEKPGTNIVPQNKIETLLLKEDSSYFSKIDFPKEMDKMIGVINSFSYDEKGKELKLKYCKEILRIFQAMSSNYSGFNKLIKNEMKVYLELIKKSLETVQSHLSKKSSEKVNEKIILSIIFNSSVTFLYLIENSKKSFADLKDDMIKIFLIFFDIYNYLPNEVTVLYQIFYTYIVNRVLLFLNKDKAYDFYYYEMFYQTIFPIKDIRLRINKSLRKFNALTRIEEENSELLSESNYSHDIQKFLNHHDQYTSKNPHEKIEDEESMLILNFLTVYTIYLNELNSVRQSIGVENRGRSRFKFKKLFEKIQLYLDTRVQLNEEMLYKNKESILDRRESLSRASLPIGSQKIQEDTERKKVEKGDNINYFEFEAVLLEAIIQFKMERNDLEVSINEYKSKKFYYYDSDFIHILVIEKILRDIEVSNKIRSCFGEDEDGSGSTFSNGNSPRLQSDEVSPLQVIMQYKQEFNQKMENATDIEIFQNFIQDQFIKNDMSSYLNSVVKTFQKMDKDQIMAMKYFNFVKKNEMYMENENSSNTKENMSGNSLVEELIELDEKSGVDNDKESSEEFKEKEDSLKNEADNKNYNIDLNEIFSSIMYLYPQYSKELTILIYKSAFHLLMRKCEEIKNKKGQQKVAKDDLDFERIIVCLIGLFKREINHSIILDKGLFFVGLNSLGFMLKLIKEEKIAFVIKNADLFKNLFTNFDFIFIHLATSLEKIVKFMRNPESLKISEKFCKREEKLKKIITFITNILQFNSIKDANILTEKIKNFYSKIIEQIIKLIFILLEVDNLRSNSTIILLIDFFNIFIQGPDIDNLNLLFTQGYFELMKYIINNIDYYQLLVSNVNKSNLYEIVDNIILIEYKIMKIFFIYFNLAHNFQNNITNYIKVRKFYEENFKKIKNKLMRIYYISQRELEGREFDIDKLLLNYSDNDFYSSEDLLIRAGRNEENDYEGGASSYPKEDSKKKANSAKKESINEKKKQKQKKTNKEPFLIKFEIILIYYTLYIQQREVMFENYFNIESSNQNFFDELYNFFFMLFVLVRDILFSPYYLIKIFMDYSNRKSFTKSALFEKLKDIDDKYLKVNENEMMEFMKLNITSVEVCINDIVYKLFFPLLTKTKKIKENPKMYIHVDNSELQNYIYHIMNSYDSINTEITQNHKVDKILGVPILKFFFSKVEQFKTLSILIELCLNIFICLSYSDYNGKDACDKKGGDPRLDCPFLLFKASNSNLIQTRRLIYSFGIMHLTITCILFFNYYVRKFPVKLKMAENKVRIHEIKKHQNEGNELGFFKKLFLIYLTTLFSSLVNFQSIFYMALITCNLCGILLHPFFFGLLLIELIFRIKYLQNVILAIYVPRRKILMSLLLFLMLIYFFALIALKFFQYHFPNQKDTKNFFKSFMRVFDQTFKQDGGVGTYLDQQLEKDYVPYIPRSFMGSRFWYDNIFYYINIFFLFQIFLSIIQEHFSSQREAKQKYDTTVQKSCLICGIEREALEKIYSDQKKAFDIHINNDHNVTDYICYLKYLQNLNKRDKIVEENVWRLHLKNNYYFLPKNTCFKVKEKKTMGKLNRVVNNKEQD